MKNTAVAVLTTALVGTTTLAFAQPQAAPQAAAPPAPQTNDWSEVSHINGTVVPVGSRGDYLTRFRKTNVSTNPVGWVLGLYGVSVSHAVSNNVALRADANLFSGDEFGNGYEFGVGAPVYLRRTYSGPFLEPGVIVRGLEQEQCADLDCSSFERTMETSVGPSMMVGWHWSFDSGLNVAAATGAMKPLGKERDEFGDNAEPEFAGYFRVGYAF